ncbi:hypothetical protein HK101_000440 [Irineochytrium annulatum]|nr:hypothetical protein HK101_000440 [Irineochytrium annulatum]
MRTTIALLAALASSASAGFTAGAAGFSYSAVMTDNTNVQITIMGKPAAGDWIGLGIPADPAKPSMESSELILVYATGTTVNMILGHGAAGPTFSAAASSQTEVTLDAAKSSVAADGTITAVFNRPMTGSVVPPATTASNILMTASSYLYATGPMSGSTPQRHSDNGVVRNVNLFGSDAMPGMTGMSSSPSSTVAPPVRNTAPVSTAAPTTTKNAAMPKAVAAGSLGAAMVVAALFV